MNERGKLGEADRKYWSPLTPVLNWVASRVPEGAKVLEIGPRYIPFQRADTFVGWLGEGDNFFKCDIDKDSLPFDDNTLDFVYCRHVLEDIYNLFHVCPEMSRAAKAGYVETLSPLAEMCRGIDASSPRWRGYHHHRYFVWNDGGKLCFLSKYPVVEFIDDDQFDAQIAEVLRNQNLYWNTYFLWEDEIDFHYFQHEIDFTITVDYGELIVKAIQASQASTFSFGEDLSRRSAETPKSA